MAMKILFVVWCSLNLVLPHCSAETSESLQRRYSDFSENGVKFVSSAEQLFKAPDPVAFIKELLQFASTVAFFVPSISKVFNSLSGLFSPSGPTANELIIGKLDEMNSKLSSIAKEITKIPGHVRSENVFQDFEKRISAVNTVRGHFQGLVQNQNSISQDIFKKSCEQNQMSEARTWPHASLTNQRSRTLRAVLEKLDNRQILFVESKLVASTFINAMYFEKACLASIYVGNADLESRTNYSTTASQLQLSKISKVLILMDDNLTKKFWAYALDDINYFRMHHSNLDHLDFSKSLLELLANKYNWKAWQVYSYSDKTLGWQEHAEVSNDDSVLYMREYGRSLWVAAATPREYEFKRQFDHCIRPRTFNTIHCGAVRDLSILVQACLGSKTSVIAIRDGHDLHGYRSKDPSVQISKLIIKVPKKDCIGEIYGENADSKMKRKGRSVTVIASKGPRK